MLVHQSTINIGRPTIYNYFIIPPNLLLLNLESEFITALPYHIQTYIFADPRQKVSSRLRIRFFNGKLMIQNYV